MTSLYKEITEVRVATSIFPPEGYSQDGFDMHLMDETMFILSEEEEKMVSWSGPDHCDPYIVLSYDGLEEANLHAAKDSIRMHLRAIKLYQNCAARKAQVEAYSVPYNELDERGCALENKTVQGMAGEYKYVCDEMERIQDLMDARSPYEFDDKRDLSEVLALGTDV